MVIDKTHTNKPVYSVCPQAHFEEEEITLCYSSSSTWRNSYGRSHLQHVINHKAQQTSMFPTDWVLTEEVECAWSFPYCQDTISRLTSWGRGCGGGKEKHWEFTLQYSEHTRTETVRQNQQDTGCNTLFSYGMGWYWINKNCCQRWKCRLRFGYKY